MTRKPFLFLCILVCLAAVPQLWAETPAEQTLPEATPTMEQNATPAEPEVIAPTLEEILDDPMRNEASVCGTAPCWQAWHCVPYCSELGSTDGYCDSTGCCVCL